jgi:hypothetical protein
MTARIPTSGRPNRRWTLRRTRTTYWGSIRPEGTERAYTTIQTPSLVSGLCRFISRLAERALPFFKLLRKSGPFIWIDEAEEAF